ncbi:MAG: hypothetical protein WA383_05020 [Terriglobales bacterium]
MECIFIDGITLGSHLPKMMRRQPFNPFTGTIAANFAIYDDPVSN